MTTKTLPITRMDTEYINNCKLIDCLSYVTISADGTRPCRFKVITIPRKDVCISVSVSANDGNFFKENVQITPYDRAVMDSVYSLCVAGFSSFTPEMVVRTMSGSPDMDVTPRKSSSVKSSLEKLSHISVNIDCTDEMVIRKKIKKGMTFSLEGPLLHIEASPVTVCNQKTMPGYQLLEEPVLYRYAGEVGQIIRIPTDLLSVAGGRNTDELTLIKRYLLRRIEGMKNTKNRLRSHKISYEWYDKNTKTTKGLYQDLGYSQNDYSNWRKKRGCIHQAVIRLLTGYISEGYIKSYEVIRRGNLICGVEISL